MQKETALLSARLRRRLIRHHLPIGAASIAVTALLYATRPYPEHLPALAFGSAYPALILICLSLLLGPWKLLAGEKLQVSFDLRRDIGIWAGILSLFHTGVGQFVHMAGRFWLYYVYPDWQAEHIQPIRYDLFGLSNHTGLFAALIILALLATSNDAALRWLGTPGWKSLQRWNYACFVLTALHTAGYQVGIGNGRRWFLLVSFLSITITVVLQAIGWRRRRAESLGA